MKVEVKKIDTTRRELKFEIPKDRVTKALDEIYVEIGKEAKIKGYRPGKAPRQVVESHYAKLAQEETIKKVIPEAYEEALKLENISPIDLPEIHDVLFKDGIIFFKALLDIRPEVSVKDYKGVKVTRKSSQVTEEDLNKLFELFTKGQGEDKKINFDDAFAKSMGYPSLEAFKDSLKRQMEVDKDRQNRMDIENQVMETLLKNSKVIVPQSSVEKEVHHRLHDLRERMTKQGMKKEDIDKREKEIQKDLHTTAEKDLKLYFILEEIARLENIPLGEGENMAAKVVEFLLKEASWEEAVK